MIRMAAGVAFGLAGLLAAGSAVADDKADLKALEQAKVTLPQAIEAAEQAGKGTAIDAAFEAEDGGRYEIKVLGADDRLAEYRIGAADGTVLGSENERLEGFFTRLKPEQVQSAPTTLAQAIALAERTGTGRALEAEVEREGDTVQYEVTVADAEGKTREITINGATGQVAETE